MWTLLTTIKIPLWMFLVVLIAAGGLYGLHMYESARIDSLKKDVTRLELKVEEQKQTIKEKEAKIVILQGTVEAANKNAADFQDRNTKLLKVVSKFGPTVVIPATGKNELNVINKADSDKFIQWLNEEIWK